MLSEAICSWRLRRLATKQNCDGYVEQFEKRKAGNTWSLREFDRGEIRPRCESIPSRFTAGQRQVLKQEKPIYTRHPKIKQSRQCMRSRGILPAWLVRVLEENKVSKVYL